MAILRVENVSMQLVGTNVRCVESLSFALETGEIFALLGPSGSGKTSTLRMIAGFEQPYQGRIVFGGRVVEDLGVHVVPEKRGMGFVFQDLALFPHLSVLDNVTFGLHRLTRERRRERALEMLESVRLSELAARYPHELSGGEQQRVALARTLAPSPQLILLDEPFANLDPSLRYDVRADVRDIIKREKMTAVLVTHDHSEAVLFADRIGVMRGGRLEQVGAVNEFYLEPRTPFVGEFFGRAGGPRPVALGRPGGESKSEGGPAGAEPLRPAG